jgi:hypothetical protein
MLLSPHQVWKSKCNYGDDCLGNPIRKDTARNIKMARKAGLVK